MKTTLAKFFASLNPRRARRTPICVAACLLAVSLAANPLYLSWQYPQVTPDTGFVVLQSTNLAGPFNFVTNEAASSLATNGGYAIQIQPTNSAMFYSVLASNMWGLSSQPAPVEVDPFPVTVEALMISQTP